MAKSSRKKANPKARVISSREVYHGPAFRVTADEVLEPSGVRTRRDIVHHSGSVVILAIEEGKSEPRVLLERLPDHRRQVRNLHYDRRKNIHEAADNQQEEVQGDQEYPR